MNKIYPNAAHALEGLVQDGMTIAVGGFGLCGIPEALIDALRDSSGALAERPQPTYDDIAALAAQVRALTAQRGSMSA